MRVAPLTRTSEPERGEDGWVANEHCAWRQPAPVWRDSFWIGAPGYAWKFVEIDFTATPDPVLELSRGSSLVVHIVADDPTKPGLPSAATPFLRLRRNDEAAGARKAATSKSTLVLETGAKVGDSRFDALEAGDYVISVELGTDRDDPLVVGNSRVKLLGSASESITIHVPR
jgi:hypothetical protein